MEEIDKFYQNLFRSLKFYQTILETMDLHSEEKQWAVEKMLKNKYGENKTTDKGIMVYQKSVIILKIYKLLNRIITFFVYKNEQNQKIIVDYLDKLALIAPMPIRYKGKEEIEAYFAELCNPDLEMIKNIMDGNTKIRNLRRTQTESIKVLVNKLHESVNPYNIGIIFQIYEYIMTESNDSVLNESLFATLWEHKNMFNDEKMKDPQAVLSKDFLKKQIQMVKALFMLVQNPELEMAKSKIQDIFQPEDLHLYIENL